MEIQNMIIGLWVDDIREPPQLTYKNISVKWTRAKSVKEAQYYIQYMKSIGHPYDIISIDYDAGDYARYGGDYIELLKWLEEKQYMHDWVIDSVFKIHSQNVVGRNNMEAIIKHNNWRLEP